MPNTSVHFPDGLLEEMDRLAAERGMSRNRLIVESCQKMVRTRCEWPPELLSNTHLSAADLAELQSGAEELEAAIAASRRNRPSTPF
jgi:hypothetical protein